MKTKIFTFVLMLNLIFTGISASGAQAVQGSKCTKLNQVTKVGKQSLICLNTLTGRIWINLIIVPTKSSQIKNQALEIIEKLSAIDTNSVSIYINNTSGIITEIEKARIRNEEINTSLANLDIDKNSTDSEITALPTKISAANIKLSQAQSALTLPQQNYTNLLTQLNSMSYEYSAAYREKSYYLACKVLNDFGFQAGGCGYYNSYNDVIISKYNALNSQVNTAKSTYDSYKNYYDTAYKEYSDLVNSRSTLIQKASTLTQSISNLKDELESGVLKLKNLNALKSNVDLVSRKQSYYQEAPVNLVSKINLVLGAKSTTWAKLLQPIYKEIQILNYEMSLFAD